VIQGPAKGISKQWLSLARGHIQWLKQSEDKRVTQLDELLGNLKDETALVEYSSREEDKRQ
jgi:hypothetical protein